MSLSIQKSQLPFPKIRQGVKKFLNWKLSSIRKIITITIFNKFFKWLQFTQIKIEPWVTK